MRSSEAAADTDPSALQSALSFTFTIESSSPAPWKRDCLPLILQMGKPGHREERSIPRSHTASKLQSWDSNPGSSPSLILKGSEGFPHGSVGKESTCNAGDTGDVSSVPGSGRSPGGGNGNPLLYPCLGNPMDRGAWRATVHGVAKSWTQLSN